MAWSELGPDRRRSLPSNWKAIRQECFERDGFRCTMRTKAGRCKEVPTDCDHVGDSDNHDLSNLTSLCNYHHKQKTARQGAVNLAKTKKKFSRREDHPGMNW